jgi:hypothetical protein
MFVAIVPTVDIVILICSFEDAILGIVSFEVMTRKKPPPPAPQSLWQRTFASE